MKKLRYSFFKDDGSLSKNRIVRTDPTSMRIVSDEPLTSRQRELLQGLLGFDSFVFQVGTTIERKKLGKYVTDVKFLSGLD